MAKLTILANNGNVSISSAAHAPHYLGKATYVSTTSWMTQGGGITQRAVYEMALVYRITNCPWPPLAFVQLSSTYPYAVRAVYSTGANQWDIIVACSSMPPAAPNVFCFGRISSAKTGGPAIRLFDSSGAPAFDSQSKPLRVVGRLDFAALDSGYNAIQSVDLPAGMTLPAVCEDCSGYGFTFTASGAFWKPGIYSGYWYLSGANLRRGLAFVGFSAKEDAKGVSGGHFDAQSPIVIETNGLT